MAKRGRPVKGVELLDELEVSHVARQRLTLILQTLAGVLTVQEACTVLGINHSRFHQLRQQFLAQAAGLLEPPPAGRPHPLPSTDQLEVQRLRQQIVELKLDLKAIQVREELALIMPHLLQKKRPGSAGKKTTRPAGRNVTPNDSTGSAKC
jgi:cytochrome P450